MSKKHNNTVNNSNQQSSYWKEEGKIKISTL